jgi:hypothetical protein
MAISLIIVGNKEFTATDAKGRKVIWIRLSLRFLRFEKV